MIRIKWIQSDGWMDGWSFSLKLLHFPKSLYTCLTLVHLDILSTHLVLSDFSCKSVMIYNPSIRCHSGEDEFTFESGFCQDFFLTSSQGHFTPQLSMALHCSDRDCWSLNFLVLDTHFTLPWCVCCYLRLNHSINGIISSWICYHGTQDRFIF